MHFLHLNKYHKNAILRRITLTIVLSISTYKYSTRQKRKNPTKFSTCRTVLLPPTSSLDIHVDWHILFPDLDEEAFVIWPKGERKWTETFSRKFSGRIVSLLIGVHSITRSSPLGSLIVTKRSSLWYATGGCSQRAHTLEYATLWSTWFWKDCCY